MAGRRARSFEDLRHAEHGFRGGVTSGEDLRVSKHDGSGIRPGILQMLFRGGPVRQVASDDTRMGRHEEVRPRTAQMLFRGGPARGVASEDLRMDHDGEDAILPHNLQMLSEGGEVSPEEKLAGHELMAAFKAGDATKAVHAMRALFELFGDVDHDDE